MESKNLGRLLAPFNQGPRLQVEETPLSIPPPEPLEVEDDELVRLALPNGHQQGPTAQFLSHIGLEIKGYAEHHPRPTPPGLKIKVIRPQDMPLQVANGHFDLAITGQDWLWDYLCCFPSSPVRDVLTLGFGKVRVVAVVVEDLPVKTGDDIRALIQRGEISHLRVASEYVHIADKYARDNHLAPYKLIPTWGASEAFLPEDADLLIENTQTGATLAQHRLKIVDILLESSACVIVNTNPPSREREAKIDQLVEQMEKAIKSFGAH